MGSSAQQYCLRWNNHRSNLLTVFDQLLQNEAFTDVTLACEGASIKCHRMVLAACSSYFRSLFTDLSCRHIVVVLKDVGYSEIKAILEYMYRGEVNVAQDQLGALLRVAETLKVKGLVEENVRADSPPSHHSPPSTAVSTSVSSVPPNLSPPRAAGMTTVSHSHSYEPSPPSPPAMQTGMLGSSVDHAPRPVGLPAWALPPGAHRPHHHIQTHHMQAHSHHSHQPIIQHDSTPPPPPSSHHPCAAPPTAVHHMPENSSRDAPEAGDLSTSVKRMRPSGNNALIHRFPSPSLPQRRDTPILRTVLGQSHAHHPLGSPLSRPVALLSSSRHSSHSEHEDAGNDGADSSQPAQRPVSLVCRHDSSHGSPDRESSNGSARESERIIKYEQSYDDDHLSYTNISNTDDEAIEKKNVLMLAGSTQPTFSGDSKGILSGIATYVPTQKPEWKRYKQYTRSDIMSAIEAVRTGMSALQAARKYGVPSRTLYDKVKKLGITTSRPFKRASAPMPHHTGGNGSESPGKLTPNMGTGQQPPIPTTPNSSPNEGNPETPPGDGQEGSGEGSSVDGRMEESQPHQLHRMPHLHFAHAPSGHVQHCSPPQHTPPRHMTTPPQHAPTSPSESNDGPEPRSSVVTAVPRHVDDGEMNDVGRPPSHEGPLCIASPGGPTNIGGFCEEEGDKEEIEEAIDQVEDLSVGGRAREVGSVVAFVPGDGSSRREGVVVKAERMDEGRSMGKGEEAVE